jgi:flavin-dependent dehydrogenase
MTATNEAAAGGSFHGNAAADILTADVLVLGGGPAGVAAGCALARRDARVVLIDPGSAVRRRRRIESLAPEVRGPLTRLGLDDVLNDPRHVRSNAVIAVWGAPPAVRSYLFGPWGEGVIVDRRYFDSGLRAQAAQRGVTVVQDIVAGIDRKDGRWQAVTCQRRNVNARWIVDATGRASWLARRMGGTTVHHDRLLGITGIGRVPGRPAQVTTIESAEHGWWFTQGLGDIAAATLVTEPDIHPGPLRNDRTWRMSLARTAVLSDQLTGFALNGPLTVCQSGNVLLDTCAGTGWIAVGDAAAAQDPLAGDGVLRALDNGVEAATVLDAHASGDTATFGDYPATVATRFAAHLTRSAAFHRRENRWPRSAYWTRHARIPSPGH